MRGFAAFNKKLKLWESKRKRNVENTIKYLRNTKAFGLKDMIPFQLKSMDRYYHFTVKELLEIDKAVNED